MSEMDFSGFDDAAASALLTDLDEAGLEGAADGVGMPDPIDDADVDPTDAAGADLGPEGSDQAGAGPAIVASDGTAYGSYTDFLRSPDRG